MNRLTLLALCAPIVVLVACPKPVTTEEYAYPVMVLSQPSLEFGLGSAEEPVMRDVFLSNNGELDMGVGSITISEDGALSYTVSWDESEIGGEGCTVAPAEDDGGEDDTDADAKDIDIDTGGGSETGGDDTGSGEDTGTGVDTGGGDDTGTDPVEEGAALFVLPPNCRIPLHVSYSPATVGDVWGAVLVESVREPGDPPAGELPAYLEDPVHWRQLVYLHGEAEQEQGTLIVRPRSHDFGYVHPDAAADADPARIEIQNVGNGDITLADVSLSSSCGTEFELITTVAPGTVIAGGASTLVEVAFLPDDTGPAYCQVNITSDDLATPEVDVTLRGNTGSAPDNSAPTIFIRSPDSGTRYDAIRPLTLEMNVFDADQPPTSLVCTVRSALRAETLASCTPVDESGHVFVEIAAENFETMTDAIVATVTDAAGVQRSASIALVVNGDFPSDDDDGDGFGAEGEFIDCDDSNILTYPDAAEVYDLEDNDCDGISDEGTEGADDDGDSYAEVDGDCDDDNDQVYPGGPERADGTDNDCDGVVDEGTSMSDDDGDGFAEINNDCNDNNADVNPSATEICDGLDNDCDGLADSADNCVSTDTNPIIVGGTLRPDQNACLAGDVITVDAKIVDGDGDELVYTWADDGAGSFDNPAAPVVNWTCPEPGSGVARKTVNMYMTVVDTDGNQAWAYDKVFVYPSDMSPSIYDPWTKIVVSE